MSLSYICSLFRCSVFIILVVERFWCLIAPTILRSLCGIQPFVELYVYYLTVPADLILHHTWPFLQEGGRLASYSIANIFPLTAFCQFKCRMASEHRAGSPAEEDVNPEINWALASSLRCIICIHALSRQMTQWLTSTFRPPCRNRAKNKWVSLRRSCRGLGHIHFKGWALKLVARVSIGCVVLSRAMPCWLNSETSFVFVNPEHKDLLHQS